MIYKVKVTINFMTMSVPREIIPYFGGPHHLSTISLKDSHLFKIVKSVINFYFFKKKILTQQRHLSIMRTL